MYLLLKNQELILNFVSQEEFGKVFLPLIAKSLACGVPKLQILALTKIRNIFTQIEYIIVKTQLLPRMLQILETAKDIQLKLETFETLLLMLKSIDSQTLKTDVIRSIEKLRARETDPKVCMKMLKVYEQIGKVLGPEEIGMKILPGVIPMLITGQFTKGDFKEMMSSVHRLLDQIEAYRMPSLVDQAPVAEPAGAASSISNANDPFGSSIPTTNNTKTDDPFSGTLGGSKADDPFATFGNNSSTNNNASDIFGGLNTNSSTAKADPFGTTKPAASTFKPSADVFGSS